MTASAKEGDPRPMLIGGEWTRAGARAFDSVNPASGARNWSVAGATAEHVDQAVAAARAAQAAPAWRAMPTQQRARLLARIAELMEANADRLAELQRLENGKVVGECRTQVASAAATFRYYAAVCETQGNELTPARGNYLSMTVHEPYGVVAAITPWNSPLTMEAQKVAPALAAGNAIILKPSEVTPSPALELGRIALEAGLAPGLLNVLPGLGSEIGDPLVEHPGVDMVSFTGGTVTGRRIAGIAARKLMPVALELGGKSPHIVFADADLDAAVDAIIGGIFEGSGQSCVAGSRLYVQRAIRDELVARVVARARALRVDLPDAPGAQMGPIASFGHRDRIEAMVEGARARGAEVLCGAERPEAPHLAGGAFYRPTVLVPEATDAIVREEIFGPVLCALAFDDEDDLVAQANDSVYGLAAGVWSRDFSRAWRVARALQAGTVWINTYKQLSIATAFGGFKDSGLGREKGIGGMRLYQQAKSIYVALR